MSPSAANRPPAEAPDASDRSSAPVKLPADDQAIFGLDLPELATRWSSAMERSPMSGEAMTGADRRAQALGVPGGLLMEHAGTAVAAAVHALAVRTGRWGTGPILVLCGPGNNGGDGFVAARRLARLGAQVVVGFVASEARPEGETSGRNWDRLAAETNVTRMHAALPRDLAILGQGIDRAAVVVDALLGTGVRGALRDPIRSAVELVRHAHDAGVPVLAVDTPTAVDLTSGEATEPVVRADVTVTFHRPKVGLRTRRGAALAGRVLVAPIGIPPEADRG
jgi:ADP-dependent NAD(P)H-hydrate dehydratase / NAD(P)H-hydrate epimerase